MAPPEDNEEEVGYGRPPKAGRFKKGASGNPKGRPKAKPSLAEQTTLGRVLNRKVTVEVDGKKKTVAIGEAVAMQFVGAGAKGNLTAQKELMRLMQASELSRVHGAQEKPVQTAPVGDRVDASGFVYALVSLAELEELCYFLSIAFHGEDGRIYIDPEALEWALARRGLKMSDIPKSVPYQIATSELMAKGPTTEGASIIAKLDKMVEG